MFGCNVTVCTVYKLLMLVLILMLKATTKVNEQAPNSNPHYAESP